MKFKTPFKGFVNIELSSEDKKKLKQYLTDPEEYQALLQQVILAGYNLKCSYDSKLFAYRAILFGAEQSNDHGLAVSGIGSSMVKSVLVALYKATEMMELGQWKEPTPLNSVEF